MDTIRVRKYVLLLLAGSLFFACLLPTQGFLYETNTCTPGLLCVQFLNVGQGDAIFVESPSGYQMLIDGGSGPTVLRELGLVMGFFDRDIDLVVATHPDKDHIGGLVDVLRRYDVRAVLLTENESGTPVASAFGSSLREEGAEIFYARSGQRYDIGGPILTVLFPDREVSRVESNTSSIVLQLGYGEAAFLLTGDAPKSIEEYLVSAFGESLQSEVLKVGHHGSKTSTAETFVSAVTPTFAVISSGKDNSYGHPHKEVLETLAKFGIETENTAEVGRIVFETDGTTVLRSR